MPLLPAPAHPLSVYNAGGGSCHVENVPVTPSPAAPLPPLPPRTWAEVDLSTLAGNVRALRQRVGGLGEVMAVVKADAYGHGAVRVAGACAAEGIRHFGVAAVVEAQELR